MNRKNKPCRSIDAVMNASFLLGVAYEFCTALTDVKTDFISREFPVFYVDTYTPSSYNGFV